MAYGPVGESLRCEWCYKLNLAARLGAICLPKGAPDEVEDLQLERETRVELATQPALRGSPLFGKLV